VKEFLSRTWLAGSVSSFSGPVGGRPARGRPQAEGRLTGRGGVLVVFAACFFGLLVADWAHWGELADAVFFMAASLTAYYVRPSGLLPVVVSPPLLFFVACAAEKTLTSPGRAGAIVAALAGSAGWLLAGMGLTVVIALLRGLPSEVRALILSLRSLSHGPNDPRGSYFRSSRGSWNAMRSLTASTSTTSPNPSAASFSSTPLTSSSGTEAPLVRPTVLALSSHRSSTSPASSTR
jgi:hypothetical protein